MGFFRFRWVEVEVELCKLQGLGLNSFVLLCVHYFMWIHIKSISFILWWNCERQRYTGRLCYHCINKSPIGTISSLISAIKLSIVHHRPKSHLSNRQLWQVHLGTEPFDPFSCKPFKRRERWHDGSTFEAQIVKRLNDRMLLDLSRLCIHKHPSDERTPQ